MNLGGYSERIYLPTGYISFGSSRKIKAFFKVSSLVLKLAPKALLKRQKSLSYLKILRLNLHVTKFELVRGRFLHYARLNSFVIFLFDISLVQIQID